MAKVCLQRPGIVPCIRQREPASMPKHVRVDLDPQLRSTPSTFNHP